MNKWLVLLLISFNAGFLYAKTYVKEIELYGRFYPSNATDEETKKKAAEQFLVDCEAFVKEAKIDMGDAFETVSPCDEVQMKRIDAGPILKGSKVTNRELEYANAEDTLYTDFVPWGFQATSKIEIRFSLPKALVKMQIDSRDVISRFEVPFSIDDKLSGQSALVKQQEAMADFCTKERERFRRDYGTRLIWFSCVPNRIIRNFITWNLPKGTIRPLKGTVLVETYLRTEGDTAEIITAPRTAE